VHWSGSAKLGDVTTDDQVVIDLADFDAVGIASDIVLAVRTQAIERGVDVAATVSAPEGWHRVVATGRSSGHLVLGVRFSELSTSRWHNIAEALRVRDWEQDEDREGATTRFPPGTEASTAAFELLAALSVGGAPTDVRTVTALAADGQPIDLRPAADR
jgi:hypothetical protein